MSRAAVRRVRATADVVVGLTWNERSKRWDIRVAREDEGPGTTEAVLVSANSQAALDRDGLWLVAQALKDELESWLF